MRAGEEEAFSLPPVNTSLVQAHHHHPERAIELPVASHIRLPSEDMPEDVPEPPLPRPHRPTRHQIARFKLGLIEQECEKWVVGKYVPASFRREACRGPDFDRGPRRLRQLKQEFPTPPNLPFTLQQKHNLKRWFDSMDADGSGEISVDELEDPLLSTGIAKSTNEVEKLIAKVDADGTGEIGFEEFLEVLRPASEEAKPEPSPVKSRRRPRPVPPPKTTRGSASAPQLGLSTIASDDASTGSASTALPSTASTLGTSPLRRKPKKKKKLNPITRLQKLQQGEELAMDTVICQQRRKLIMNAVMRDMVHEVAESHHCDRYLAEARSAHDAAAIDTLRGLKAHVMERIKSREDFLAAMQRVVDANHEAEREAEREKAKQEAQRAAATVVARDPRTTTTSVEWFHGQGQGEQDGERVALKALLEDPLLPDRWFESATGPTSLRHELTPRTAELARFAAQKNDRRPHERPRRKRFDSEEEEEDFPAKPDPEPAVRSALDAGSWTGNRRKSLLETGS